MTKGKHCPDFITDETLGSRLKFCRLDQSEWVFPAYYFNAVLT